MELFLYEWSNAEEEIRLQSADAVDARKRVSCRCRPTALVRLNSSCSASFLGKLLFWREKKIFLRTFSYYRLSGITTGTCFFLRCAPFAIHAYPNGVTELPSAKSCFVGRYIFVDTGLSGRGNQNII